LVSLALLTATALSLRFLGLERVSLFAAVIAVPISILVPLFGWAYQTAHGLATSTPDQLDAATRRLGMDVQSQWRIEASVRGLRESSALSVRWKASRVTEAGRTLSDTLFWRTDNIKQLAHAFLRLHPGRLVILGRPGSGKTTLAVLLTLGICGQRAPDESVPLLLSADSWSPAREELHDWVERRLIEDYPWLRDANVYGRAAARSLVARGRVLPIIDGLDELSETAREAAIPAVNRALLADDPLVMTCRTAEFQALAGPTAPIAEATIVEPDPIRPSDAVAYLRGGVKQSHEKDWEPLFEELRIKPGGPLATVLSSPLMIALLRASYTESDADPSVLVDRNRFPDESTIEAHLLDRLIAGSLQVGRAGSHYQTRPPNTEWDPEQATRWLTFLANQLRRATTHDIAWWHMVDAADSISLRLIAVLVVAAVALLFFGVFFAVEHGPVVGMLEGARQALQFGTIAALVLWLGRDAACKRHPPAVVHARTGLASGLAAGLLCALLAGAVFGFVSSWRFRIPAAVDIGVPWGLICGFMVYLCARAHAGPITDQARWGQRHLIARGIIGGLLVMVVVKISLLPDAALIRGGLIAGFVASVENSASDALVSLSDAVAVAGLIVLGPVARPTQARWRIHRHARSLAQWLAVGLMVGVLLGLVEGSQAGLLGPNNVRPDDALARVGGIAIQESLLLGARPWSYEGLRWGVDLGLRTTLMTEVLAGLVVGSVVGLFIGVIGGLQVPIDHGASPASTLRSDRRFTVICGFALVLAGGLLSQPSFVSLANLMVGLMYGLLYGMLFLLLRPWPTYVIARVWLALRGCVPWRFVCFLEDMHHLGVLRRVGAVYQFSHVRLEDHLALPGHVYRPAVRASESIS
jgi:hypothetical protein